MITTKSRVYDGACNNQPVDPEESALSKTVLPASNDKYADNASPAPVVATPVTPFKENMAVGLTLTKVSQEQVNEQYKGQRRCLRIVITVRLVLRCFCLLYLADLLDWTDEFNGSVGSLKRSGV